MDGTKRAYLELHLAVLLFGFTAILGDLIQLSALIMVWWRVLLTCISILFFIRFGKTLTTIPKGIILRYMGIGILVAVHWVCFFGAVKLSNASIGLVCMATTTFFTALMEPFFTRQPVKWHEILLGLAIVPGMVLIVNSTELSMMNGIWVGLLSAFLAALFAIFNKQLVDKTDPMSITFLELGSSWIFLSILLPFYFYFDDSQAFWPQGTDWLYLLTLALLCTTLGYVLVLRALKYLSAFASNLTINLEPVYGIVLAWLLLKENEELSPGFYWGCGVILCAVFGYSFLKKYFGKKPEEI